MQSHTDSILYLLFSFLTAFGQVSNCHGRISYPVPDPIPSSQSILIYDASNGDLSLDYAESGSRNGFTLFELRSESELFRTEDRELPPFLDSPFVEFLPSRITGAALSGVTDFVVEGILPPELTGEFLSEDLTVVANCPADACGTIAGLRVMPEPITGSMAASGGLLLSLTRRRKRKRKPNAFGLRGIQAMEPRLPARQLGMMT